MPTYKYVCESCGYSTEIFHMMSDEENRPCPECNTNMSKQIGLGYAIIKGGNSSPSQLERDIKNREERAKDLKNKTVQRSHAGKGSGQGRALGGQHFEVDKKEFIQAAAKDPGMVKVAQDALKKSSNHLPKD